MDLCDSCRFCSKVSGYGKSLKFCHALDGVGTDPKGMNFPVESCTSFEQKGELSRYEMEQVAVYIEKKKDSPGFRFTKRLDGREVELA